MTRRGGVPGRRLLPPGAAALFAVTLAAAATPVAPATTSPTVDEIVDRHVAARGGLKKIRSIQTLRETGRITAGPNREGLVTREVKRPGRTRFEFTAQGVTGVFVSDGRQGWKMSPFDGDTGPIPLTDDVVKEAAAQADIEGPLVDWKTKGHQVELVGGEMVGGRETYKLKIVLKNGVVLHEYLDVKSLYRARIDITRHVRGMAVQVETTFGDYKKTGGIPFPRLIEIAAVGRPQRLRVVVDTVEVNPPLSDARFVMSAPTEP